MKLLKLIPLLLIFVFLNTNAHAAQHCGEIKGNIVGKLFCKVKSNVGGGNTEKNTSSENTSSLKKIKEDSGWTFWKKPEWMKKKN